MKKDIILYALSTFINKGYILIFFPFLTVLLSLEDFGIWSLIIIVSNLLIPIISFNTSASILREGSEDVSRGMYLLKQFFVLTIIFNIFIIIVLYLLTIENWIIYSMIIAFFEALLLLVITYYRVLEKAGVYFFVNFIKIAFLFALVLYAKENNFTLYQLLDYHILVLLIYTLGVCIFTFIVLKIKDKRILINQPLLFSLALIPHGLSQWIMSSSDRVIIKYMLGSREVGIYSLAYNISLTLMLINSAIALVLPTYLIKNYQKWKREEYDNKIIKVYTIFSISLFILILSIYQVDKMFFNILGYYGEEMFFLILIIYIGIYLFGLYYFYANYLFFHKKALVISKTTFRVAIMNIIFTILFSFVFGILGAAIATLISYIYYLYTIRMETLKVENNLNISFFKELVVFLFCTVSVTLGFNYAI